MPGFFVQDRIRKNPDNSLYIGRRSGRFAIGSFFAGIADGSLRGLRRPSREQAEPALRDLEPALAIFRGGGPVGPILCVFGVAEVFFFALHIPAPALMSIGRTRRPSRRSLKLENFQKNLDALKKCPPMKPGRGSSGLRGDGSLSAALQHRRSKPVPALSVRSIAQTLRQRTRCAEDTA